VGAYVLWLPLFLLNPGKPLVQSIEGLGHSQAAAAAWLFATHHSVCSKCWMHYGVDTGDNAWKPAGNLADLMKHFSCSGVK
jgi:hypothetical protein